MVLRDIFRITRSSFKYFLKPPDKSYEAFIMTNAYKNLTKNVPHSHCLCTFKNYFKKQATINDYLCTVFALTCLYIFQPEHALAPFKNLDISVIKYIMVKLRVVWLYQILSNWLQRNNPLLHVHVLSSRLNVR